VNDPDRNSIEWNGDSAASAPQARKPYCKPSFRYEQVFETMALQCGKTGPVGGACSAVRMAS
jgi:hypothetical protein